MTVVTQAELALLFILAGLAVALLRAFPRRLKARLPFFNLAPMPVVIFGVATTSRDGSTLLSLLLFFIKAGAFVFGSGLAVVPFLYEGVVRQHAWLNEQQFRDAVAVAMITPGPVVITVAFIGYLVAGFAGASVAAAGIFVPVYFLTIIPLPWFRRHRDNPQLKAFVAGATAAAVGAIAGAVVVIGRRALIDLPTVLIALATLGLLLRFKLPEPLLVVAAGTVGVLVWILV